MLGSVDKAAAHRAPARRADRRRKHRASRSAARARVGKPRGIRPASREEEIETTHLMKKAQLERCEVRRAVPRVAGKNFRLKDMDPATPRTSSRRTRARPRRCRRRGWMARRAARHAYARITGPCCSSSRPWTRRQGGTIKPRDLGDQPAGLPGHFVQAAVERGARSRFPVRYMRTCGPRPDGIFNRSYYEDCSREGAEHSWARQKMPPSLVTKKI